MKDKPCEMWEDERDILQINNDTITLCVVGWGGVTKIECYQEKGQLDFFPYIAVWHGDYISKRMPAIGLTIIY